MKKLLILNGSHSEIPLILAGKKLGFKVITTGNSPDLIGHSYAHEYYGADFSKRQDILSLANDLKIDAICSCANDFGIITASYVAQELCLAGHDPYEVTLTMHQKHRFKNFALSNDILTPYSESFESVVTAMNAIDKYTFPLIIKPVDLTGGKGISKVMSKKEYKVAVSNALLVSREKCIIIEEFIEGALYSLTTFILNGKVVFNFSDNEFSYINPYLVSTSAAPAEDYEKNIPVLIRQAERIVSLLSLSDGVFHMQYMLKEDEVRIIEITRRCSGDFYPYPVNFACGFDWSEWIVKSEAGMDCSNFPQVKQKGYCGRHCIMSSRNGLVKNVKIDESLKGNIFDEFMMWKKGDRIENYMSHKLGVIFLRYDSLDEMIEKTKNINSLVTVELSN